MQRSESYWNKAILSAMQDTSNGGNCMLENLVGSIAGMLGIVGLGWQMCKMLRTKKTEAISYSLSIMVGGSTSLWMAYGISRNDPVIYVPNAILMTLLAGIFSYKMHREQFMSGTKEIKN